MKTYNSTFVKTIAKVAFFVTALATPGFAIAESEDINSQDIEKVVISNNLLTKKVRSSQLSQADTLQKLIEQRRSRTENTKSINTSFPVVAHDE
jgi:hypothetical protein